MSNVKLKKKWTKWYPEKIYLKNLDNDRKVILNNSCRFTEKDFCETLKEDFSNENEKYNTDLEVIDAIKTTSYEDGFKKGFEKAQKENFALKEQLNTFFLEFEKAFSIFEKQLYFRLLNTVSTVSSYVIGKKINVDESILVAHVKKTMNQKSELLKKPLLLIHPDNKILIEKKFKDILKTYEWKVIYDDNIDLNGCKIQSESGDIDATSDARWQELYRFICSEEY